VEGESCMVKKFAAITAVLACCAFWLAGDLNVSIREYDVPTPKSRPHDPAVAPDGALWYTGQMANQLGRLDPKTGTFKEFR
jgi:streptogramin lyase